MFKRFNFYSVTLMLNKSKRLWTKTRQIKAIKSPFNVKELQS